jgi:integrating conjugative element protein (TIGR03755 family)
MRSIGVGVGWNSNLICGDMSITTTLQNQLNGITNGFQQIMSNVIQSATSAVASLPALIIQRADPGLYNLLTNGVLQARLDFDRSKLTCRAMAEKMADMAGGQLGWSQMAEGMALRDAVSSTDAVSAIEQAETRRGNDGVPWVGGSNAGGAGQSAIRVVGDVTRAGYNLVNGRSVTDTSSIAPPVARACPARPGPRHSRRPNGPHGCLGNRSSAPAMPAPRPKRCPASG